MTKIYLHTGSNIGDRMANLELANDYIEALIGHIDQKSNVYETAAWGLKDQDDFLNQALEVTTNLSPEEVLGQIKFIENKMGRVRYKKWGRRLIDIDILFFDLRIIQEERLKIPHPFLQDRNFVLAPLVEIIPDFIHPVLQKSIAQIYAESEDELKAVIFVEKNAE